MIGEYWVGQIPATPMIMVVQDNNGNTVDLTPYDGITLRMLDGNNREVDTSAGTLEVQNARLGRLVFHWPATTLFNRPGQYVMQLALNGPDVADQTTTVPMKVRQFGGATYVR